MKNYEWAGTFRSVYSRAVERYQQGHQEPSNLFSADDLAFLRTLGCSAQELFDFVEDYCRAQEPAFEDVLLVTAVRREYFLEVQGGRATGRTLDSSQLPAKSAELGGIRWLPRIIEKAKAKLRGEMPPELMYGCGGDRPFLRDMNIHLADFLRLVWRTDGDPDKVLAYVQSQRATRG